VLIAEEPRPHEGILEFAILGFGAAAAFALLGQGTVLIYRGSTS
jgi:hypothetical protein